MQADLLHLRRESDARHLAASTHPEQRPVQAGARADRHVGRRAWVALALVVLVAGLGAMSTFRRSGSATESRETRAMLAVLPFENLSEDAGQEYFADGLTEEMTARLGQLQPATLGVIARTSTARYKQTKSTAAQIGRELGVGYLLDGSVRRAGDRVRVIAQLVDASKQTQLWSETYERPVTDVLHIQQEAADRHSEPAQQDRQPAQPRVQTNARNRANHARHPDARQNQGRPHEPGAPHACITPQVRVL